MRQSIMPRPRTAWGTRVSFATTAALILAALSVSAPGAGAQSSLGRGSLSNRQPVHIEGGGYPQPTNRTYAIEPVGAWGGPVNTFEKDGTLGYCGAGQRLVVLDMTDPTNAIELGSVKLGSEVMDLKVRAGFAYVATRSVASSSNPISYDPSARTQVAGFHVVDVSNPAAPQLVWSSDDSANSLFRGEEIDLWGNYAFMRDSVDGIWCADITDPFHPTLRRHGDGVVFRGGSGNVLKLNDLVIQGDIAFAATQENLNQLRIYDLSTITPGVFPLEPQLIGTVNFFLNREAKKIAVDGAWVYVLLDDEFYPFSGDPPLGEVIWALDCSNPAAPVKHGSFSDFNDTTSGNAHKPVYDIAASNGRLYAADGAGGPSPFLWDPSPGLMVFDVATDPGQPELIGTHKTHASVHGVVGEGDIAYLLDLGEGLIVADTTDPNAVIEHACLHSPAAIVQGELVGDLLYVADEWNGLSILDVSDIAAPALVGTYQTPQLTGLGVSGLDVLDGVVYLAAGHEGLEAIDVSDPSQPVRIGAITFPDIGWYTRGIVADALAGSPSKVAYLSVIAPPSQLLFSVNVSNPSSLAQLDPSPLPVVAVTKFVRAAPGKFYAALDASSAVLIDGSAPANLSSSPVTAGLFTATSVALKPGGGTLYLTGLEDQHDSDRRLITLDVSGTPSGVPMGTGAMERATDITAHPLGLVALSQEVNARLCKVVLLNMADPASPSVMASAPIAFSLGGSLSNRVIAEGERIFVTDESTTGLESFRLVESTGSAQSAASAVDTLSFLAGMRSGDQSADLNADGHVNQDDVVELLRLIESDAK